MALSCDYEQWLPTSPVQGGFAFDDAYSSDGSSVMLAANPSKRFVRPGFTPLGLVPSRTWAERFSSRRQWTSFSLFAV